MKCCFYGLLIVAALRLPAQSPALDPLPYAGTITADDLHKYLSVLASDEMEGRAAGTEGNLKAARYIADCFRQMGLPAIGDSASWFQHTLYQSESWNNTDLQVNANHYKHSYQFYGFPGDNGNLDILKSKKVIFLGYGIDDLKYSDYAGTKVKGKVILIMMGEPLTADSISRISGTREPSVWSSNWLTKLKAAKAHGAKAVLMIDPDLKKSVEKYRKTFTRNTFSNTPKAEDLYPNNVFISTDIARDIAGKNWDKLSAIQTEIMQTGKPKSLKLSTKLQLTLQKNTYQLLSQNVLGYIEGTDPLLKNEVIILSAHYDHLGKRGTDIYHGADDDGSGTSAVIDIAEAFATAKSHGVGPRRSVLCLLNTAEEKGLLGSKYYAEHPIFPLSQTVADLNIDMIGRIDDKHKGNPDYIYVIGDDRLSTQLHQISENANSTYAHLELDYTYNAPNDPNRYYYRSDHYNFAEKGIPVIFYFNGTHADYHRPTDTIDKIDFNKMEKIARLAFYTAWDLANREDRIKVDK